MKATMKLVVPLLVLVSILGSYEVHARCCGKDTWFGCCGTRPCNFFCCNCEGDCKPKKDCFPVKWVKPRAKRSMDLPKLTFPEVTEVACNTTLTRFMSIDTNGDNRIDFSEFTDFATEIPYSRSRRNVAAQQSINKVQSFKIIFADLDKNQNGVIDASEFDQSLV